mgnify:CR=1 FL=1|tara:strand:+ start:345 stop:692 length:348 start_codon:yes stop_codon:yes gene_type:complete
MPRRAPDGKGVTEHRITFGNYERQFVTEVKNDIEKGVKIATISAVAVPAAIAIGTITGLGLLGYGIYRGCNSFQAIDAASFGDAAKNFFTFGNGELYGPLVNPLAPLWESIFKVI